MNRPKLIKIDLGLGPLNEFWTRERYPNGAMAVQMWDDEGPAARLSVNVPGFSEHLPPGVFYLKGWSENFSLAAGLLTGGYLELVEGLSIAEVGYEKASPVKWTAKGLEAEYRK